MKEFVHFRAQYQAWEVLEKVLDVTPGAMTMHVQS